MNENEKTTDFKNNVIKYQNELNALHDVKKINQHLESLRNITTNGMESIVKTITAVDDQSQKILLRSFNRTSVNQFSYKAPVYKSQL